MLHLIQFWHPYLYTKLHVPQTVESVLIRLAHKKNIPLPLTPKKISH